MTLQGTLSPRDLTILQLLQRTPATSDLILKASVTFPNEPFRDVRRVREKLQTLVHANLVRAFPATQGVGGPVNWYKLTKNGFLLLHGPDHGLPHRSRFEAISPSRFAHISTTAEIIVHTLVAAHKHRIAVAGYHGDGELLLESGEAKQIPDCHFGFECAGRFFNVLFEIDNSTEPLNSERLHSIRSKLRGYEAYQDSIWYGWKRGGEQEARPYFRVVFLTKFAERALHILWLARECARNPDRHLCYAGTQSEFLSEPDALRRPLFNDHHGNWQSLVNLHPTSRFLREPVKLSSSLAPVNVV